MKFQIDDVVRHKDPRKHCFIDADTGEAISEFRIIGVSKGNLETDRIAYFISYGQPWLEWIFEDEMDNLVVRP
jgi:hypothetical protein